MNAGHKDAGHSARGPMHRVAVPIKLICDVLPAITGILVTSSVWLWDSLHRGWHLIATALSFSAISFSSFEHNARIGCSEVGHLEVTYGHRHVYP